MSDYVHGKAIRLPFPKEILDKCETDDPWDCEEYLREILGDLFSHKGVNGKKLKLEATDEAYYIDWNYYYTYGEQSGDWGSARMLTEKELEVIKPYFDKLGVNYKDDDLRRVEYCYYNSCECGDYYDTVTEETDDSAELI